MFVLCIVVVMDCVCWVVLCRFVCRVYCVLFCFVCFVCVFPGIVFFLKKNIVFVVLCGCLKLFFEKTCCVYCAVVLMLYCCVNGVCVCRVFNQVGLLLCVFVLWL